MNSIIKYIEKQLGYNKFTQAIVTFLATMYFYKRIILKISRSHEDKRIFVSFGMPSYLFNISLVLEELANKGFEIYAFAEWLEDNPKYNEELKKYQIKNITIFDFPASSRLLANLKCNIFLSSVAGKKYYFPKKGKCIFYFHSIAGLDGFTPEGLDAYDYLFTSTNQQYNELTERFKKLQISKNIYKVGYPKLDKLINKVQNSTIKTNHKKTILYAPTYVSKDIYKEVSVFHKSIEIIDTILDLDYRVIFRPHPVMIKHNLGLDILDKAKKQFINKDFEIDLSPDYFNTYIKSDLMITDISGTSINFRLAFNKPVIFFTISLELAKKALEDIEQIGKIVFNLEDLIAKTKQELQKDSFYKKVNDIVYNLGKSNDIMVQTIINLSKNEYSNTNE